MPQNPERKSSNRFFETWKTSFEREERLPTAYLFVGPPGSGHLETAEQVSSYFLGEKTSHPDRIRIAPERKTAKSEKLAIRIQVIRDLIARLSLKPFSADRIIVILEEAETMTEEAANSLLKILEEPPNYVLFILVTSAAERLPGTIRSRCQKIPFYLTTEGLIERLKASFEESAEEVHQLLGGKGSPPGLPFQLAERLAREPQRFPRLFETFKGLWHDLAILRESGEDRFVLFPKALEITRREAGKRSSERIFREIDLILETERALEGNVHKTLALERLFVKLTAFPS